MKYVIFGDELTLPRMQAAFGSDAVLSVVASNRPQSRAATRGSEAVQPAKTSGERQTFVEQTRSDQS